MSWSAKIRRESGLSRSQLLGGLTILLAALAYRFRTFLVCYLLHTVTAGTIVALIYYFHPL